MDLKEMIDKIELKTGKHEGMEHGACIMELVSYLANETWSDNPKCACPILTKYAIGLNDSFNKEHRQLLKPAIPLLINSKSDDKTQIARKKLIMWRNVTAAFPLVLDGIKLPEFASALRLIKNTEEGMLSALKILTDNKKIIKTNAYAYADAAAYAAAYANAYAYADADAYATANAAADAYAYAYGFKKPTAEVLIETLIMAAKIKSHIDTLKS